MPGPSGLHWEARGLLDGSPVILSPGLGGSAAFWEPNVAALGAHHRLFLYDHRGMGRSAPTGDEPVTVAAWADDMLRLMDEAGLARAAIVGHAAGGLAGLALALNHPDRVAGLVVVNGWSRPDPHMVRCFETRLALLRDSGVRAFLHAQPLFLYPPAYVSAHSDALTAAEDQQVATFPSVATAEARVAAVRAFDIHLALDRIATPALILSARDDMQVPEAASVALAGALPNAVHVSLPWGGHAVTVTDPAAFHSPVLDFLARLDAARP